MKPLSPGDARHLEAAQGWLELGNHLEANEELEKIAADWRSHPDVLEVRWEIYAKAGQWAGNVDIGRALTQLAPERAGSWIKFAFALHEMKRTQEAWNALLPVATNFPRESTIPYNLACYAAQLGRLAEARDWLAQAFRLGNVRELKLRALEDPDLAPLWQDQQ